MPRENSTSNHSRQRCIQILDAASELFRQRGYSGLNIDRIAADLNLSKGVIYNHFPNKEEIALQLVVRLLRKRSKRLESLCAQNVSSRERLVAAYSSDFDFHREHLHYSPLAKYVRLKYVQAKTQPGTQELAVLLFNRSNSFYSGLVRYGVSRGDLILPEQSLCEDIAFILESMIIGVVDLVRYTNCIESNGQILMGNVNRLLDGLGWKH